jgi:subtilisin-like proprotein convertase family protein
MQLQTRTWCVISLVSFAAGIYLWRQAQNYEQTNKPASTNPTSPTNTKSSNTPTPSGPTTNSLLLTGMVTRLAAQPIAPAPTRLPSPRLANTTKPLDQLLHSDDAILLHHAFIQTTLPLTLGIPEHLRAKGDPGSYIVQSRGPIDNAFRADLSRVGAQIVSYVPNNAYLVRMSASGARQLRASTRTQAVMPYEPYYKLDEDLLPLACERRPLPEQVRIKVTLFTGERDAALKAFADLGAQVLGEDQSPFGPQLILQPAPDSLTMLAQLPCVQLIEQATERVLLNDLTRVQLGVAADSVIETNYLGLTGSNLVVNLNDSGVDQQHPDLTGRVLPPFIGPPGDPEGHGTHIAGIIVGSGQESSTVTNAYASLTNASFRGLAPGAQLFPIAISLETGPLISDAFLQETAAATNWITLGRTNAMISNNSWGYRNVRRYDTAAASYDAAVRDALPEVPGSQPLLYVFAAGDNGGGAANGLGGTADSVISPATAKNVITVGAIEHLRNITNSVITSDAHGNSLTNKPFLGDTDTSTEVAAHSSRGNVGIGIEGSSGRFKPDVVAPGTFVISTRSSGWEDPAGTTDVEVQNYTGLTLLPGAAREDLVYVRPNAIQLTIRTLAPGTQIPAPLQPLEIYLRPGLESPTDADLVGTNSVSLPPDQPLRPSPEGYYTYRIRNPSAFTVPYDLQTAQTLTNANAEEFAELERLNADIKPYYRYGSGTSVAAAAVSGLLALMQEYFEQKHLSYSPALMKALLINGARSTNPKYSFTVNSDINYQGWGLVNLPTSLPPDLTHGTNTNSSVWYLDQSPERSLATGQRLTWRLQLDPNARDNILRITLVWTDPPGNPNVAVKLVNDLDLVVTNLDSAEVYQGNNIPFESDFTQPNTTNSVAPPDTVNNVENVFLRSTGTNYSITVLGRRVNVNAVSAHTNDVVQDFALVISVGDGTLTNAFRLTPMDSAREAPLALLLTNGIPLLNQRVGANSPLLGGTNGQPVQWSFYVFTNAFNQTNLVGITNGPNVAFISFFPPNISRPRNVDADIDLYVSRDQADGATLLELNPAVIAAADKSTQRGGTEVVFYTNSFDGEVFYIGVKAEDQQASEFGLVGLSSQLPFDELINGRLEVRFFPFNAEIPDGSPTKPGAALLFGVATRPVQIQNVIAYDTLTHEEMGDLLGNLSHGGRFVVLNNHHVGSPINAMFVYDDTNQGTVPGAETSDGPGSLNHFIGEAATGAWQFTMVDNSLSHTGLVHSLRLAVTPAPPPTDTMSGSVLPKRFTYFFVDVPSDATNLTIALSAITPGLPLDLYARRGDLPNQIAYDKYALISPPGGELRLTPDDVPPLNAGRYFIGVFNPNTQTVSFQLKFLIGRNLAINLGEIYSPSDTPLRLLDDALSVSIINVPTNRILNSVDVAVRLDHTRASDLTLYLVSPLGTRLLLAEDRGLTAANGFGAGDLPEPTYTVFTENTNRTILPIKFVTPPFTPAPPSAPLIFSSFEGITPTNYTAGETLDGWSVETNSVAVLNNPSLANDGTNLLSMTQSRISQILPTIAGREYRLRSSYRAAKGALYNTGVDDSARPLPPGSMDPHYSLIQSADPRFPGPGAFVVSNKFPVQWLSNSPVSQWIGPAADQSIIGLDPRPRAGTYIYRTTFDLGSFDPATASIEGAVAVDINLEDILLNGRSTGISYRNGQYILSPPFTIAGGFTNGLNTLDFVTHNDTGPTGFRNELHLDAHFRSSTNAPLKIELAGVLTNSLVPGTAWQTNLISFVAPDNGTPLAVTAEIAEVLLDSLVVREAADTWILPEESLNILAGETAAGPWKLEVWDTRAGPNGQLPNGQLEPVLLSWQVRMRFVIPTPEAVNLTTNGCFDSTVSGNEIKYFYVDVPRSASMAINTLDKIEGTGNLELLYRSDGVPVGTTPPDDLDQNLDNYGSDSGERLVLTRYSNPPLHPGQRYYLGVRNAPGSVGTNSFTICAQFDRVDNVILLTNAVPYTNTIAAGTKLDYYQFNVAPNAYRVSFDLLPVDGNVDLYARWQVLPQPAPNLYDYASTNPGTNTDQIVVTPGSTPTPLRPGPWYLGVRNPDPGDVTYSIVATELTNEINVITLSNCVPIDFMVDTNTVITNFFRFYVTETNPAVRFDLYNMTGLGELFVAQDNVPLPPGTVANAGQPAKLLIRTNDLLPSLNGNWYLAVLNYSTRTNLAFTIQACLQDTNPFVIPLTSGVAYSNTVAQTADGIPAADYYSFMVSPNAAYADFEVFNKNGALELLLQPGALPTTTENAFSSSTQPYYTPILLRLAPDSTPIPLTPGLWYLSVVNRDTRPVTYSIRATESLLPSTITFINPELIFTNGLVCLRWPSQIGVQYQVQARTNLANGQWDALQTQTADSTLMQYCLPDTTPYRFFQIAVFGAALPSTNIVINPVLTLTADQVCLAWPALIGTTYLVQARTNLLDPAWLVLLSTNAVSTQMTYCLDLSRNLHFFQIESPAPANQSPATRPKIDTSSLTYATSGFTLRWTALAGERFHVVHANTIPPVWKSFTNLITSTNGQFTFTDDGSQSGGLEGFRLYQLRIAP